MRLTHHSKQPLGPIRDVKQDVSYRADKPHGLWVSVDDDWRQWCMDNDFECGALEYEIELAPRANIIRLTMANDIDRFTRKYSFARHPDMKVYSRANHDIDWLAVAAEFDGIIIAPYVWELRLDSNTLWYYGWDCASGCIWNARAVARVRNIEDSDYGIATALHNARNQSGDQV
jgi:hypothetical protein